VLRDLHPLVDSPCRSLADSGARVPKVLPTAELEGSAQELTMEAPLVGQEGIIDSGERETFIIQLAKDSEGRSKATRSEGDDLEESAARALMRPGGRGHGERG
jgi:hypothetical protein